MTPALEDETKENTVVTLTCFQPKRYVLMGKKEITCTNDGTWSSSASGCTKCGRSFCCPFQAVRIFLIIPKMQTILGICLHFTMRGLYFCRTNLLYL